MKGLVVILIAAAICTAWYYLPASHHRAATGTYFLREYISFNTATGVTGWCPGQEIHEVMKAPFAEEGITVSDGKLTAVIPEALLTQDIEDAEAMRLADGTSQDQAKSRVAAVQAHAASQEFKAQVASAQNIVRSNALQVAASTIGTYNTRLNEPTRYVGGSSWSGVYYGSVPTYPTTSTTYYVSTPNVAAPQTVYRNVGVFSYPAPIPRSTPNPASVGTAR